MKTTAIQETKITRFCDLINSGIEAWVEAGQLLVEMLDENPESYLVIMEHNPHMTREVLESFERIGRKEIYPFLVVDGSPGARRLAALPYDTQARMYGGSIDIVKMNDNGCHTVRKKIADLTIFEADLAFDLTRVRTTEEQAKILRPPIREREAAKTTSRPRTMNHVAPRDPHPNEEEGELDENTPPATRTLRFLNEAEQKLLAARTSLNELKIPGADDRITTALQSIGKLRWDIKGK